VRSDVTFSHEDIVALLGEIGDDLADKDLRAEMFIVGGATMALAYNTRRATRDIDAVLRAEDGGLRSGETPGGSSQSACRLVERRSRRAVTGQRSGRSPPSVA